jgi:hypothetical protein
MISTRDAALIGVKLAGVYSHPMNTIRRIVWIKNLLRSIGAGCGSSQSGVRLRSLTHGIRILIYIDASRHLFIFFLKKFE